jgi:hypothetical protein
MCNTGAKSNSEQRTEGGPMADESLIREALAEAERNRRREKRARLVRWNDLEKELAQQVLTELGEKVGLDG